MGSQFKYVSRDGADAIAGVIMDARYGIDMTDEEKATKEIGKIIWDSSKSLSILEKFESCMQFSFQKTTEKIKRETCMAEVLGFLIDSEKTAQKQYGELINMFPAQALKIREIKKDEADHEKILKGVAGARGVYFHG